MLCQRVIAACLFTACFGSIYSTSPLLAQIVPDGTLGNESSVVKPNATVKDKLVDLIESGAIRDDNLFHSFSEFNVPDGQNVYFANPDGIANILTRVTGNNISKIFGTLGVDGAANLFLLNSNGIVFGENATLDVNGSFLATTADSYIFDNDFAYSASNPEIPPLLTVNIPVGLQMGNNPAGIEVRGTGSNLILGEFGLIRDERTKGLEVREGNTLALLGAEINLTGGNLTAESGNIELGSVEAGKVTINPQEYGFSLGYEETAEFRDINLTQASSLDTSGNGGGRFQLSGKNISILEESLIVNNTLGNSNGKDSQIVATDTFKLLGTEVGTLPTGIIQFVEPNATGNSGEIAIETGKLEIIQNALILNGVTGDGNGGDLKIAANTVKIDRDPATQPYSTGLLTGVLLGKGNGGDLTIDGDRLIVRGGGEVSSTTVAEGNGGDSNINVARIDVVGTTANGFFPSSVFTVSDGTGNAGNLTINGDRLVIKDGGQIASGIFGAGDGGDSNINVAQIEIIGIAADGLSASGLFSSSIGTGDAGDLTINGDRLLVKDGGQIDSGTFSAGDGGDSNINVTQIEIIGTAANNSFPSGLFSSSIGTGDAGDLTINGDRLLVKDGGQISSGTSDIGDGGDSNINVAQIEIMGTTADFLNLSGLFSSSNGTGNAGNLAVNGDRLIVRVGGQISSGTFGEGDGGDLTINVAQTEILGSSADGLFFGGLFSTSDGTGNAGDLTIDGDFLLLKNGGQINSGAFDAGDGGNLTVDVAQTEILGTSAGSLSSSGLYSASSGTGNAGNLTINSDFLLLKNGGTISSSTINDGNAGNLDIKAQNIEVTGTSSNGDLFSQILAVSEADSPAGFLEIVTDRLDVTNGAEIAVSNTGLGDAGNLTITASEINLDRNGNLRAEVDRGQRGNINLITNNLFLKNNSRIDARAFNDATGGNIRIDNTQSIVLQDNSQINASAKKGNGGNIEINTRGYFISADSLVTASSDFGLDGNVEVEMITGDRTIALDSLPESPINAAEQITAGCSFDSDFAIAGSGGLPPNPLQALKSKTVWQDFRFPEFESKQIQMQALSSQKYYSLTEANNWQVNNRGNIELIANFNNNLILNNFNCQQNTAK